MARRFEGGRRGLDGHTGAVARDTQHHRQDSPEHARSDRTICAVSFSIPSNRSVRSQLFVAPRVLEDVQARLKDASSKTGIKNWKVYQNLRSIASKRPRKCKLLFQTCQDDVVKAVNSLRVSGSKLVPGNSSSDSGLFAGAHGL